MNIETTSFAAGRHFAPGTPGTTISSVTAESFDAALADCEIVEEATEGFVRHVLVRNFTDAMSGVAEITDANRQCLRSEHRARREGELAVLTRWFPAGTVEIEEAEWLHLVLYSREQLAVEGLEIQSDWGIVSINAGPTAEFAPLGPASQMRNAMGIEQGGNGNPLDADEYARGVAYWNQWATVSGDHMAEATFCTHCGGFVPSATVTIQRSTPDGLIDITVAFAQRGGQWFFTHILDEEGNEAYLSETEELLARSLVEAGVDETGR